MRARLLLAALLTVVACATSTGQKGRPLSAFAPEGVTDLPALRHALLVGVDRFEDPSFTDLHFASADARALGAALSEFDDVKTLVRPEETRRAAILEALAELEKRIRSPRDTILIYFSTHGSLAQRVGGELERYLVVGDTRLDLPRETGISVDELIRRAERLASRRVAVVLATCHSGRGKSRISDGLAQALAARKEPLRRLEDVSEAVVVLSAAAFGEAAREDETLGHDVYTYFLIEAAGGAADRDGDGAVTISEAHDYARERTWQFTHGQQRPAVESAILGIDPIVLRGRRQREALPVIYSYDRSAEGIAVRLSGQTKGVLPGGFAVPLGEQKLELLDADSGERLYSGTVRLQAGDRVDLSRLIPPARRIEVALEGGLFAPLSIAARGALPAAPEVGLQLRARHWPAPHLAAILGVSAFGGVGTTGELNQAYDVSGLHLRVGMGRIFDLGRGVEIEPQLLVGNLWMSRRFREFPVDESLSALTLSPAVELGTSPSDALRLRLRLEADFFSARFEATKTLNAAGTIGVLAGYSF